jgi:hypothetical protein
MEEWRDVIGFEGFYEVSNIGRVRNYVTKKIRLPYKHKGKYLKVSLHRKGFKRNYPVHRLVAMAFIPNEYNKLEVNHKDLNKMNNYVDNLEWVTGEENREHYRLSIGVG